MNITVVFTVDENDLREANSHVRPWGSPNSDLRDLIQEALYDTGPSLAGDFLINGNINCVGMQGGTFTNQPNRRTVSG